MGTPPAGGIPSPKLAVVAVPHEHKVPANLRAGGPIHLGVDGVAQAGDLGHEALALSVDEHVAGQVLGQRDRVAGEGAEAIGAVLLVLRAPALTQLVLGPAA